MIKSPLVFLFAIALLLAAGGVAAKRVIFLADAKKAPGTVADVRGYNSQCSRSCGRRCTTHYNCTKFTATIQFQSESGDEGSLSTSAGSVSGHGASTTSSNYKRGGSVPIIYNPRDLSDAYINTFMGLWGTPFMIFVGHIITLIGSFSQSTRRRRRGLFF